MIKKLLFILFLWFHVGLFAQNKSFTVSWDDDKIYATNTATFNIPHFEEKFYRLNPDMSLTFTAQWSDFRLPDVNSVTLSNVQYEAISRQDLGDLNLDLIPTAPEVKLFSAKARNENYTVVELSPIVRNGSGYQKITAFTVNYQAASPNSLAAVRATGASTQMTGLTNSVLGSGIFYKFYVDKTGIFKITRRDLQNMGLNPGSIDPRNIKIYGNGGRMLPLRNSEPQPFDVPENAIFVSGETDGSFDSEDFILFYAEGPFSWNQESNTNINLYTEETAYFITADGGVGKRIVQAVEPTAPATQVVTDFDEFQFHEQDLVSVANVGRQWHGEKFDVESEQTFTFDFPNLVASEPIQFAVDVAAAAENLTSMSVAVNGQNLTTLGFTAVNDPTVGSGRSFSTAINASPGEIAVTLTYNNQGNPAAIGYLNYINIEATSTLRGSDKQFPFTKKSTALQGGVAEYQIQNAQNISQVWEVSDRENIRFYPNNGNATFSFKSNMGSSKKFVALVDSDVYEPIVKSRSQIAPQDLKGTVFLNAQRQFQDVDYLVIAPDRFMSQAQRLADYHFNQFGRVTKAISLEQIYNEFSTSNPDIAAIRNFVRYVYLNASSPDKRVKYLCLLGDSSFDYKDRLEGNNNVMPTFHALPSFSLTGSFMSDDFFVVMDENEGTVSNIDRIDIAVGRLVADTPQVMDAVIEKIIRYNDRSKFGRWRNNFTLLSDDVDANWEGIIQESLDILGNQISTNKPFINVTKLHSDAFLQELVAGGERYPQVNEAIKNSMEVGTVVLNYFGHGGEEGLAGERLVTQSDAINFGNRDLQPLFVTVTCEYTRFDNPLRPTAGEFTFWNANGGAVGLITTTRQVFVQFGLNFNLTLQNYLFSFASDDFPTLGESLMFAKNEFNNNQKRVVFLVGDPAMTLAVPKPRIQLTQINDRPVNLQALDTIKSLGKIKIAGEVGDENGQLISDFNGTVFVTVYDKNLQRQTLANDGTRDVFNQVIRLNFETLGEIVYRGKASVTNGRFDFEFRAPRDIRVPIGRGRISFYAERTGTNEDRTGFSNDILVGGIDETAPADNQGPVVRLFMNDENFVSGEITNSSPFILALLEDENGINTASGIGHDIVAILDGDEANPIVMNDFYETELDDFTKGRVRFPLRDIAPGLHTLKVIAWDVYNNSSMTEIQFVVAGDEELKIERVLNYPNPFVNFTEFWFTHNRPFEPLEVQVQVFTVTGKLVWTKNQIVNTEGFLSRDITWDGRDDFGDRIGKGVYVYKLTVRSPFTNKRVQKIEKLVIL
jgi:hypothetical protein